MTIANWQIDPSSRWLDEYGPRESMEYDVVAVRLAYLRQSA
jgi:hypothetical protein